MSYYQNMKTGEITSLKEGEKPPRHYETLKIIPSKFVVIRKSNDYTVEKVD